MIPLIPGQHIHLVGIGGFGLSAIARVLLQQGFLVSGSDRSQNLLTQALARDGAIIYVGHDPAHVDGAEMVIVSSAVPPDHVEVQAAKALGIPVYKRQDIIGALTSGHTVIAVAGTHGKTTTTGMITHILIQTGQHPNYIIGGVLKTTLQNANIDSGRLFVVEADEYDNMFHGLRPQIEIITGVEWDHPDFFTTPNEMTRSFSHFISLLADEGLLITCADDPTAIIFAENRLVVGLPVVTYGITNPLATWRAVNIRQEGRYTVFDVIYKTRKLDSVQLIVPGRHNVLNALAALAVAQSQDIPFQEAVTSLSTFEGTSRRFELRGEVSGVAVIDDYAHHPTAIKVTLETARQRFPGRTIWAVWQPHTYSRIRALWEDYLTAFGAADHLLVTDIYAAREQPVPNVTGEALVEAINHPDVRHTPNLADALATLDAEVLAPAAIIILSAGDAPLIGAEFLKRRRDRTNNP